jgi:hypothetical protein
MTRSELGEGDAYQRGYSRDVAVGGTDEGRSQAMGNEPGPRDPPAPEQATNPSTHVTHLPRNRPRSGEVSRLMLNERELLIAARAAWEFRETGRFPSERLCEERGEPFLDGSGQETPASTAIWLALAAALNETPTHYLRLLAEDPHAIARRLLLLLGKTPEELGWRDL